MAMIHFSITPLKQTNRVLFVCFIVPSVLGPESIATTLMSELLPKTSTQSLNSVSSSAVYDKDDF